MKVLLNLVKSMTGCARTCARNISTSSEVFTPKAATVLGDTFTTATKAIGKNALPLKSGEKTSILLKTKDKVTGKLQDVLAHFSSDGGGLERVSLEIQGQRQFAYANIRPDYLGQLTSLEYGIGEELSKKGNCIWVEYMRSNVRGCGTLLHKAIAQRSIDLGYQGRVALDAAWCSHPFHYKCGFRPLTSDLRIYKYQEEDLLSMVAEAEKLGKRFEDKNFGSMSLFLSPQKAKELLQS